MTCNYCHKPVEWVDNSKIYNGKRYGKSYMIWWCKSCDAYVGCHNNTLEPLGTLANRRLRKFRKEAKELFIEKMMGGSWNNRHARSHAYGWLNKSLGVSSDQVHFGMFDEEKCKKVIELLTDK